MKHTYQQLRFPNIDALIRQANPSATAASGPAVETNERYDEAYYEYVEAMALEQFEQNDTFVPA